MNEAVQKIWEVIDEVAVLVCENTKGHDDSSCECSLCEAIDLLQKAQVLLEKLGPLA